MLRQQRTAAAAAAAAATSNAIAQTCTFRRSRRKRRRILGGAYLTAVAIAVVSTATTTTMIQQRILLSAKAGGRGGRAIFAQALATAPAPASNHNNSNNQKMTTKENGDAATLNKIAIVGGGASGIFASIAAAETASFGGTRPSSSSARVVVLEATTKTLQKVKISGGGRCNVMHDANKPVSAILGGYPRGSKELNGTYRKRFTPAMARDWFEARGVELKTERDGRMFPATDSSQTIVDVLMGAAVEEGVEVRMKQKVESISATTTGDDDDDDPAGSDGSTTATTSGNGNNEFFEVRYKDGSVEDFSAVIIATGSSPSGLHLAKSLGHTLVPPVPSLFTLNCKHDIKEGKERGTDNINDNDGGGVSAGILHGLSGVSVPFARVSLLPPSPSPDDKGKSKNNKKKRRRQQQQFQEGPLLITHQGVSGPAVLRLSAFLAHEFHERNYRGKITIHWDTPLGSNGDEVFEELWKITSASPKKAVSGACPLPNSSIPRRLWSALARASGVRDGAVWGEASKKTVRRLANNIVACPVEVTGKSTNKEEFVTAGGVPLKEIDMTNMESKIRPGLFFCGEVLNVDGVTGGFNFMNCWSTGFLAGCGAADHCSK